MTRSASQDLVEYLKDKCGPSLRSAAHYNTDEYEFLYFRDDVAEQYTKKEISRVFDTLRSNHRRVANQGQALNLGKHGCTVEVYERGILLDFTQTKTVGTVVTLDTEVGQNLVGFIISCLRLLQNSSPHSIATLEN